MKEEQVIKALEMALKRRGPDVGLLHHSDQGCTYASEDYRTILEARSIVCSMSRRGHCYVNAVMESFFATVKSELGEHFDSHGHAKMEVFDYIEVFYNQRRRHSTLGQISPRTSGRRRARSRTSPSCTGGYSSLPRRENVGPGASYEVAVSAIAVPPCRCAPWDPMDDRHRPVVRSASFTVGALGGLLIHAIGARAIAAEPPAGRTNHLRNSERPDTQSRLGQRAQHN